MDDPRKKKADTIADLKHEDKALLVVDFFHRIIVHYALWFTEVRHQMGPERALEILGIASERSLGIQLKRLSKMFHFELKDGLPAVLHEMAPETLQSLLDGVAVNWLANDGVWFQAVEFENGMNDAKRCNDSCWAQFSPFEAWSIRRFLDLPVRAGLEGLKKALNFRLYASINSQSFAQESKDSFVFQMNQCRVQNARKRKGLDDYPCKSGGLVEYARFAAAIDSRIQTECIGCPPDDHPEEWYCAWRFFIEE